MLLVKAEIFNNKKFIVEQRAGSMSFVCSINVVVSFNQYCPFSVLNNSIEKISIAQLREQTFH